MRVILSIILFTLCVTVFGQDSAFKEQKRFIDSIVTNIDTSKDLKDKETEGNDSVFGNYIGNVFYRPLNKTSVKIESIYLFDTIGSKVFHYNNDNLIRVMDNKVIYYCLNEFLFNDLGMKVQTAEAINLLRFQKSFINQIKVLLRD